VLWDEFKVGDRDGNRRPNEENWLPPADADIPQDVARPLPANRRAASEPGLVRRHACGCLGAKGHLKDPGHPLEHTGKVVNGKQKTVKDGPYAEAKDVVGGYIVIEAKDIAMR
jgi:hypothetical protein